jgi:hypothetical protein
MFEIRPLRPFLDYPQNQRQTRQRRTCLSNCALSGSIQGSQPRPDRQVSLEWSRWRDHHGIGHADLRLRQIAQ